MNLREALAWSSFGPTRAVLFLALCLALTGCVQSRYAPVTPMIAQSADIEMRFLELRIKNRPEFVFMIRSAVPHSILQGWLTVATRSACTGGARFEDILVDAKAERLVTPGQHELRLLLPSVERDLELDLVVDLLLGDGSCVRAPAVSQVIPLEANRRLTVVLSLPMEGHQSLAGLRGNGGARLGAGGWVGPLLATVEVGIGAALCTESVCGKHDDGTLKSGLALPIATSAQYFWTGYLQGGLLSSFVLGARYVFQPVSIPALGGSRSFNVHGAHALLGWAIGDGTAGPFTHRERNQLLQLGIPLGLWAYPDANGRKVGWGTGLEVRVIMPL